VLRISVAGGLQPFVLGCPHCRAELRGSLYTELGKPFELRSEDFDLMDEFEERADDLAVAVSTDLPVHLSLVGQAAKEAMLTPFIKLSSTLGTDLVGELMPNVDRLRALREHAYPHLRRAASYFARGDLGGVEAALRQMPGGDRIDFAGADPIDTLGYALAQLYAPLENGKVRQEAAEEWAQTLGDARSADEAALKALFAELQAGPLGEHRARVVDTALAVLGDIQALLPPMWAERMGGRVTLNEYRVMRDDFDTLKSRYQDIFELGSRTLAFTGRVANIARRGDVRVHADGIGRSFNKALNKTTANNREPWLADFPKAKRLYDAMKRHTRNDIGHRLVRYDFERGSLVYDDGPDENYLHFLVDYLHAVRLSHYLLDVIEVLWHVRQPLTEPPP
jgi:hypothetical protein